MAAFSFRDPLALESFLTQEERAVQESASLFTQNELMPRLQRDIHNRGFDVGLVKLLGSQGFLGATLSGYGCAGVSSVAYGLVAHEIEKADSSYRSALSVQSSLVMYPIYTYGSCWQKEKYLPALRDGTMIGAFGLTEPDHGSDPSGMATRLRKHADGTYRMSGSKTWITNAPIADVFLVWAKDEHGRIRGVLLERGMGGLATPEIHQKGALLASKTGMICMDDVVVHEEQILPHVTNMKGPLSCLTQARYGIAWGALGAAHVCYETARQYVLDRTQFGRPLAANQAIQIKLATMASSLAIGVHACWAVGKIKDQGLLTPEMVSLIKRNSCKTALDVSRTCRDMLGGNGISLDYPIFRHMTNLEVVSTYEGTDDIHGLILGKAITGISAF